MDDGQELVRRFAIANEHKAYGDPKKYYPNGASYHVYLCLKEQSEKGEEPRFTHAYKMIDKHSPES